MRPRYIQSALQHALAASHCPAHIGLPFRPSYVTLIFRVVRYIPHSRPLSSARACASPRSVVTSRRGSSSLGSSSVARAARPSDTCESRRSSEPGRRGHAMLLWDRVGSPGGRAQQICLPRKRCTRPAGVRQSMPYQTGHDGTSLGERQGGLDTRKAGSARAARLLGRGRGRTGTAVDIHSWGPVFIWQPGFFCLFGLDNQDALGTQPIRITAKSVEPEEATWDARRR